MFKVGAIVLLLAALPNAGARGQSDERNKAVAAGDVVHLAHFASVNPDCTSRGKTVVRVTEAPAHGIVRARDERAFSTFRNHQQCDVRKVDGVTVEYRPVRGFVGADRVGLDVIFPTGNERFRTYNLSNK